MPELKIFATGIVAAMQGDAFSGLEPVALWRHFAALSAIPRPSGHEDAVREYVKQAAEAAGASCETDSRGNLIARVAATDGCEGPVVAIQSHLDMVCERDDGVAHDCERDPIVARRDGDWILATGTTLGADNGIGVAAALAVLSDSAAPHGPLELVFTVEEETGLLGAAELDVSRLDAELLINLDSEDDRALTVGCAGGAEVEIELPVAREAVPTGWLGFELRVSGLSGGHSGMQIHEPHANAIVLVAAILGQLRDRDAKFRLESIDGGSAHNAIPRSARVRLALADETGAQMLEETVAEARRTWKSAAPELELSLSPEMEIGDAISAEQGTALISLLGELPHGVLAMSHRFADTVETSANLATVRTSPQEVRAVTSIRSLKAPDLRGAQERIEEIAGAAGASAKPGAGYPGWEPREHSRLLDLTSAAYRRVHRREPAIEVLHGGLECGVIVAKKPELDAISFGPLIEAAHSPDERLKASTVPAFYRLLTDLLADLGRGAA